MEKYYDNGAALWGLKCGKSRITEPLFVEVFDIRGEWAAVRFEDKNTGVVNDRGEVLKRFLKLERMEFTDQDFVRLESMGKELLMDMRSMLLYSYMPERRFYGEFELLFIGGWMYTRTKQGYGVKERPGNRPRLYLDGLYLTLPLDEVSMTGHLENYDEDEKWLARLEKWVSHLMGSACLLAGDDAQAYWLYRQMADRTIVVIDNDLRFYHVTGTKDADGRLKAVKQLLARADEHTEREEMERILQPIADEIEARVAEEERKHAVEEEKKRVARLETLKAAEPFRMGIKWGLKLDGRIVVPPLYRTVRTPVGRYCAVEKNPKQWGIMEVDGKMVVEPKYEEVELYEDGTAELTVFKGKKIRMKIASD